MANKREPVAKESSEDEPLLVDPIETLLATKFPLVVSNSQLTILDRLGEGKFGTVYRAILKHKDRQYLVAVKKLKSNNTRMRLDMHREFQNILRLGRSLHAPAAIGFVGDSDTASFCMELLEGENLLRFIRDNETTLETKARAALGLAEAMEYLKANRILHRDLAARNCVILMADNCFKYVKLVDFGHSHHVGEIGQYEASQISPAFGWTAIESLEKKVWSFESDIWSLAVVIWEIYSNGMEPYALEVDARTDVVEFEKVKEFLANGGRLCVDDFPVVIQDMLPASWNSDPKNRPSISNIMDALKEYVLTFDSSQTQG